MKLAKGQAACEGRNSEEVVEERWGSLGQLAASVSTYRVASSYAHLQSIRGRKAGQADNSEKSFEVDWKEDRQGVSSRDHAMRKLRSDSVPWKKNRHNISSEDQTLISSALASINKFAHDGSFMEKISTMMVKIQMFQLLREGIVSRNPTRRVQRYIIFSEHSKAKCKTVSCEGSAAPNERQTRRS